MVVKSKKMLLLKGNEAIEVTNIKGTARVTVETSGKVAVNKKMKSGSHSKDYYVVAETDVAKLKISTHGYFKKVEIRLAAEVANHAAYQKELTNLFDKMLVEEV